MSYLSCKYSDYMLGGVDLTAFLEKYSRFLNKISKLIEFLLIILLGSGVLVVLIQITGRWFGSVPPWTEEYARYSMVWLGLIGSSLLVRSNSHLGVDIFLLIMNRGMKKFAQYLGVVTTAVLGAILIYYGIFVTMRNMDQLSPGLNIPFAYVYLSLPIAGILFVLYCIERIALLAANKGEEV